MRVVRRNRERLPLFKQCLSEVFESACDHKASVGQIEALRNRTGKIERLRHHHFSWHVREVERDVIAEHRSMIIRVLPLSGADRDRGVCDVEVDGRRVSFFVAQFLAYVYA